MTTDIEATTHTATDEPRDLDTLMHLGTYQGMSDAEIQLCIEEYKARAYREGARSQSEDMFAASEARIMAELTSARENAEAAFNNAILSTVKFETVADNG